jgi:hypothetical protein
MATYTTNVNSATDSAPRASLEMKSPQSELAARRAASLRTAILLGLIAATIFLAFVTRALLAA